MSFDEDPAVEAPTTSTDTQVDPGALPPVDPGDEGWLRLDKRKLLLDPIKAVRQTIIPIIALLFGFSNMDNPWWMIAAPVVVVVVALFGLVPWFTTTYRITPTAFQLRKGVFSKTNSTAPLDRIRSVDLEATVLHRLLGMRKVQIGTGVDSERIELDAVTTFRADELRGLLLTARSTAVARAAGASPASVDPGSASDSVGAGDAAPTPSGPAFGPPADEYVLAQLDWSWLRFAPFSLARLAVVAAALGLFSQFVNEINLGDDTVDRLGEAAADARDVGIVVLTVVVGLGLVVGWLLISVIGYLVQWWGLRLTREAGILRMSAGLLTTRSISVEEKRVRGVALIEPLLMRPVRGAELATLATGVGDGGTTKILPHCPTDVATDVAGDVLGDAYPMRIHLRKHGFAARRRRHVAFQWTTLIFLGLGAVGHQIILPMTDAEGELWWFLLPGLLWISLGVLLAELSYAHLGHALTDDHLVAGHGTTARTRTVLEVDGIIGWVFEQSFFQRRLGLVTLHATTAAGGEQVTLTDIPETWAVRLASGATREPVRPFLLRRN